MKKNEAREVGQRGEDAALHREVSVSLREILQAGIQKKRGKKASGCLGDRCTPCRYRWKGARVGVCLAYFRNTQHISEGHQWN